MKTVLTQLIEMLERTVPSVKNGNALDKQYWLSLEKEELCDFWVDGNKHGWAMDTDWPEHAKTYYDEKYGTMPVAEPPKVATSEPAS